MTDKTHDEITADNELGIDAKVIREVATGENYEQANKLLKRIGHDLVKPSGSWTQDHYHGSFAVHVYWSRILREEFAFVVQNCPIDLPEWLADKAVSALRSDLMAASGRAREFKRSGF